MNDKQAETEDYLFLQCADATCRFRFPAPAAETAGLLCPRCRGAVNRGATRPDGDFRLFPPLASSEPAERADGAPLLAALLDNIRSVHNVGSMFRTADGAGIAALYLAGITATPGHPRLAKAALGAQSTVGWRYYANSLDAAAALRAAGYALWALEPPPDGRPPSLYEAAPPDEPLALVIGNERAGIDPALLARCDAVFSLPMRGGKSSLNAAVAFGIAVYHLRFGQGIAAPPVGSTP